MYNYRMVFMSNLRFHGTLLSDRHKPRRHLWDFPFCFLWWLISWWDCCLEWWGVESDAVVMKQQSGGAWAWGAISMKLSVNQQAEHNNLAVKITSHLIQFHRVGRDAQINKPAENRIWHVLLITPCPHFVLWWAMGKLWRWFILARTLVEFTQLTYCSVKNRCLFTGNLYVCAQALRLICLQTCLKQVFCFYVKCAGKGNRN